MPFAIRLLGYARKSALHRNLEEQKKALQEAGCSELFIDVDLRTEPDPSAEPICGISSELRHPCERPALEAMLSQVRSGDMVVVWRLDRLGRSFPDLAAILSDLSLLNIGFKSLCEKIDTTAEGGDLVVRILEAVATFDHCPRQFVSSSTTEKDIRQPLALK